MTHYGRVFLLRDVLLVFVALALASLVVEPRLPRAVELAVREELTFRSEVPASVLDLLFDFDKFGSPAATARLETAVTISTIRVDFNFI
jgi:hypothetical protein